MNFRSVAEMLHMPVPETCVCGQTIPLTAVYYGVEAPGEPIAWINEWHEHCLGEFGWRRDDSEMGIGHTYCVEQADESVIRRRLDELTNGYGGTVA